MRRQGGAGQRPAPKEGQPWEAFGGRLWLSVLLSAFLLFQSLYIHVILVIGIVPKVIGQTMGNRG